MSFTQNIATQVKRFACDRCHGQKLRCPRRADGGLQEPCVRCSKAGTPCGITTPSRMGRPNKSRKLNTGEGVPSRPSSPKLKVRSRTKALGTRPRSEMDSEDDQPQDHNSTKTTCEHASRSSSVNLTLYDTYPSIDTPALSDTAESAPPMVMNDFFQHFDFDLDFTEFTDAMQTSIYDDDDINRNGTESLIPQEEEGPPVTVLANAARQTGHRISNDGHTFERTPSDIAPEEGTMHGFNHFPGHCPSRYTAYATPPGVALSQASTTTLTPSTVPPPTLARTSRPREDPPAHPRSSHSSQLNTRDNNSIWRSPSQAPSPPELNASELRNRQSDEQKSLAGFLQMQQQICDCSEDIMQANRSSQDHSRALGKLFCATDRFISHVSHISGNHAPASSSTPIPGIQPSTISDRASPSSTHGFLLDPSMDSLNQKEDLGSSHHTSPFPSAAVFYIIMACHARILTAYEAIINTTPATKVLPCQSPTSSTTGEYCSIGSFTVRPGTSLESLLHLQVISHQLDHLNSALYCYMMTDASLLSSRLGSNRSSSSPLGPRSTDSLQDFAVQAVEQQGNLLKGKIVTKIAEM